MMKNALAGLAAVAALSIGTQVDAGSHLWRFNEIYSNADGSIMFIELKECCGANNETVLAGKDVSSNGASFIFPANLPCSNCTANKHLLLATAAYAALPGVPAPDYIIDANFFDVNGDTLTYWFYGDATWSFGMVPTDGSLSLTIDSEMQVNSPTNFAGETGTIDIGGCENPADINGDEEINVQDLVEVIVNWGRNPGHPADINGDTVVDVQDLVEVIVNWGPC